MKRNPFLNLANSIYLPADLRAALSERGLSQQGFARLVGCNPRTIRRWCDPRRPDNFNLYTRCAIASALEGFDRDNRANRDEQAAASCDPAASSDPASSTP